MSNDLTKGSRVEHSRYGEGIVSKVNLTTYEIFFERGGKVEILKSSPDLEIIELDESSENIQSSGGGFDMNQFEEILSYALDKYGLLQEVVPLGEKWIGGTMILKPANPTMQAKEIPIDSFFHKIVMVRDRLRVLEQNINSHSKLSDEEKVNLQQYISRIYGSLTTFNILFKNKDHNFVGTGGA